MHRQTDKIKDRIEKLQVALQSTLSCRLESGPVKDLRGEKVVYWLPDTAEFEPFLETDAIFPVFRFVYLAKNRDIWEIIDDTLKLRDVLTASGFSIVSFSALEDVTVGTDSRLTLAITAYIQGL